MSSQPSKFQSKIKLFSDGADKATLLEMNRNPRIAGMTTNPSLMKKAGVTNYKEFCLEVLKEVKQKPISFEVFADDLGGMEKQARVIHQWGSNVYVKIPVVNSLGELTSALVSKLSKEGIKLNVTALFTVNHIQTVCHALKGGAASIISIFAGRIADAGRDPLPTMHAAFEIARATDPNIEVLWASTREVYNIIQAEEAGCDIITVPPDILKKLSLLNSDLTHLTLDTVRTFKKDSEGAGFKLEV